MPKIVDLTGRTFGRLNVIKKAKPRYNRRGSWWTCRCECGTVKDMQGTNLVSGESKSCGCRSKLTQFKSKFKEHRSEAA